MSISIIIHTYNEEKNIVDCIDSGKLLTNDIIMVDMGSNDRTVEIAKNKGVHIFTFPFSHYVEPARNFGIQKAQGDWVFILDADERMTNELAKEIKIHIQTNPTSYKLQPITYTSYKIPRKNMFGGKQWLRYGGWWPDYQLRLIHKKSFREWPDHIHSTPLITGNEGKLTNPFLHYFHGDFAHMVDKTILYEHIEAGLLHSAHRDVSTSIFFRKFFGELFRRLIKWQGFRDGKLGIIESIYQAFSKTITYIYLYEKTRNL